MVENWCQSKYLPPSGRFLQGIRRRRALGVVGGLSAPDPYLVTLITANLGWVATFDRRNNNVRGWHETDKPTPLRNVRSQEQSGNHMLALRFSGFGPIPEIGGEAPARFLLGTSAQSAPGRAELRVPVYRA